MKIVQPITTTDTTLTSSNVLENDYAQWNVGTTYTIGTPVIVTTPNIHKIYESAASGNTGNDPVTDDGTWWTEISATNLWKMFDGKTGTAPSITGAPTTTPFLSSASITRSKLTLSPSLPAKR